MTLRNKRNADHVVDGRVRAPGDIPPYIATLRRVLDMLVPGAIGLDEVSDWALESCTDAEARELTRLRFAFDVPTAAPGDGDVILNLGMIGRMGTGVEIGQ